MEFTGALQKLGGYHPRSSQKSKETLRTNLPLLKNGTFVRKGETGECYSLLGRTRSDVVDSLVGWESIEGLFLAALDEGDVKTATVRCPTVYNLDTH